MKFILEFRGFCAVDPVVQTVLRSSPVRRVVLSWIDIDLRRRSFLYSYFSFEDAMGEGCGSPLFPHSKKDVGKREPYLVSTMNSHAVPLQRTLLFGCLNANGLHHLHGPAKTWGKET
jgi:hypothetical protein